MLPADSPLTGEILLSIARDSIACALEIESATDKSAPWLAELHATFVTLKLRGMLRGCIGSLEARRSLVDDVSKNAVGAAFQDPRFPRLRTDEFAATVIEVSLLSPPQELGAFATEAQAIAELVPHQDGVILELGSRRATFLPQVWESLPEPHSFLAELKQKAGLAAGFWSRELRISRYMVQKWSEANRVRAGALP